MKKKRLWLFILIFIACFMGSFMIGKYPVNPWELIKILLSQFLPISQTWSPEAESVVLLIRLPRILSAALIGAALSVVGLCYQGIFQNPMVSPDVLGVSAGSGFGAALGLFCSFGYLGVSVSAVCFGILAMGIVLLVSNRVKNNPILGLILTGIMAGSLFSAATSFIKLVADPTNVLPAITYWLMGSLASIRNSDLIFASIPILIALIPLFLFRWKMNVLALGEEEARTIGINSKRLRLIIITCGTVITAACVSVSGMIGWIGLVIPHLTRILVGCNYKNSMPVAMLMGGSFLILVDDLSRVLTTSEIPIGILTAFVGAPFFIYLILREGNKQ